MIVQSSIYLLGRAQQHAHSEDPHRGHCGSGSYMQAVMTDSYQIAKYNISKSVLQIHTVLQFVCFLCRLFSHYQWWTDATVVFMAFKYGQFIWPYDIVMGLPNLLYQRAKSILDSNVALIAAQIKTYTAGSWQWKQPNLQQNWWMNIGFVVVNVINCDCI